MKFQKRILLYLIWEVNHQICQEMWLKPLKSKDLRSVFNISLETKKKLKKKKKNFITSELRSRSKNSLLKEKLLCSFIFAEINYKAWSMNSFHLPWKMTRKLQSKRKSSVLPDIWLLQITESRKRFQTSLIKIF